MNLGTINIINKADSAQIDIEGIIGIPENWQFEHPDQKVSTYKRFKETISQIKGLNSPEVIVNIRSIGGNVNDALLIYDTLSGLSATITTKCYGYTASAATIIAQAASPGKRIISDNSLYLIHQASTIATGNSTEIKEAIGLLEKTDERLVNIYSSRSGKESSHFLDMMSVNNGNGEWLSPDEVIEAGLADIKFKGQELVNDLHDEVRVFNLPPLPDDKITKRQNMKIKETWKAVLDYFGFDKNKENELTEAQLEELNNVLEKRQEEVKNITTELENIKASNETSIAEKEGALKALSEKENEISNLQNKVSELEAELAQKKAEPTQTEAKEDPDPVNPKVDPRVDACAKDLKSFKEQIQ